jgi:prepilin-type N-terminal cleavage/methylation domain-containing protein
MNRGYIHKVMDSRGVTLIELLVALGIVGILVVAMGMSFKGWTAKYKTEGRVKKLQSDIMLARSTAVSHSRAMFFIINSTDASTYYIYEDTDPTPDGDLRLDRTKDKRLLFTETGKDFYGISDVEDIIFKNGIINMPYTFSSANPDYHFRYDTDENNSGSSGYDYNDEDMDYNCVKVGKTSVGIGLYNATTNTCDAK